MAHVFRGRLNPIDWRLTLEKAKEVEGYLLGFCGGGGCGCVCAGSGEGFRVFGGSMGQLTRHACTIDSRQHTWFEVTRVLALPLLLLVLLQLFRKAGTRWLWSRHWWHRNGGRAGS